MNLDSAPRIEQLREILRQCDDSACHHLLWVKKNGDVELSCLPRDQPPVGFAAAHPDMQVCCEPFQAGNEYVGPEAAADAEWVAELFECLIRKWSQAKGGSEVAYVEPW